MEDRKNEVTMDSGTNGRGSYVVSRPTASPGDRRSDQKAPFPKVAAGVASVASGPGERQAPSSWVSWQFALYAFVQGAACLVLVPLTSLWWIFPVLGAGAPLALAMLQSPGRKPGRIEGRKAGEKELLKALAERGELTPTAAAMHTSLTAQDASKRLRSLARKGYLVTRDDEGPVSYALHERDRQTWPGQPSTASGVRAEVGDEARRPEAPQRLDDPLSERELEVLQVLASGKTNSEVARELFVSVGTVKSHTGNIYRKLDAKNRVEALARARDLNLIS